MPEKKNAMVELAERLEVEAKFAQENGRNGRPIYNASRIVAELAKVENPIDIRTVGMTHLADILESDKKRAVEIVRNCRIIAMEGAGDVK